MKNYDYGIIGNCTSAALVSSDCSIEWLCLPFFDSPSVFGRLIDVQKGGYFRIAALDVVSVRQNYLYHTPIIKTVFETKHGVFEVRDYMPRFHIGAENAYCPSEIHRDVYVLSGRPKIIVELKPCPNYGLGPATFSTERDYLKIKSTQGEYNSFYLYSNLDYQKIIDGEPIEIRDASYFLLSYHEKLEKVNMEKIYLEYEKTKSYWLDWTYRTKLPEKYKEIVIRSFITLKLLMYQRTGAVIAAPTTSLPETIGESRNWDYRYCWVRDGSMVIDLYTRLGHSRLASRYISFILNRMLLKHDNIAVMYGINGERVLTEKVLDHLAGYENSRPVRIGNDAYRQKQNDVYGVLIETIYATFVVNRRLTLQLDEEIWTVVRRLVNNSMAMWKEPDSGIWEMRGEMKHYVYSKMMNWVAMDRAAQIAEVIGRTEYAKRCRTVAAEIKEEILTKGFNQKIQSFTMHYETEDLDAANLLMLHYGFLERNDPRMVSTVRQTYKKLVKNGFAFRYTSADDFGYPKNAFIVCTFWMINALYLIGDEKEARAMLENLIQCANPMGLFSEDIETDTRRLTGNFPQGYSHLALIQSVFVLETEYNWQDVSVHRK